MIYSSSLANFNRSFVMQTTLFSAYFCLVWTSSASQMKPNDPYDSNLSYWMALPLMLYFWGMREMSWVVMRDTAEELDSLLEPIFPLSMFSKSANIAKHYELYINQRKIMVVMGGWLEIIRWIIKSRVSLIGLERRNILQGDLWSDPSEVGLSGLWVRLLIILLRYFLRIFRDISLIDSLQQPKITK